MIPGTNSGLVESGAVGAQALLGQHLLTDLERKAKGIVQEEELPSVDLSARFCPGSGNQLGQSRLPGSQRFTETSLL